MLGNILTWALLASVAVSALAACSSLPPAAPGPLGNPIWQAPAAATPATAPAGPAPTPNTQATLTPALGIATTLPPPNAELVFRCDSLTPTPAQAEGPYFKAGAPQRQSLLEPGMPGTRLVVQGRVLTQSCVPVAGARLDFWQTDAQGEYDNTGYRMRGHQFTDDAGQYRLETVVPGRYPGRPPHIHVKVSIPNGRTLTTQLYFPGANGNPTGPLLSESPLVLAVMEFPEGRLSRFDFVP